jgi:hypothetical protein
MVPRAPSQLSSGSKLIRLATSRMGSEGRQCVSFFLSPGHTTYQRVNTTVNDRPVTVTPPIQDAPEDYLVRPRDHRTPLAGTVGGAEIYQFCTQICIGLARTNRVVLFWRIQ